MLIAIAFVLYFTLIEYKRYNFFVQRSNFGKHNVLQKEILDFIRNNQDLEVIAKKLKTYLLGVFPEAKYICLLNTAVPKSGESELYIISPESTLKYHDILSHIQTVLPVVAPYKEFVFERGKESNILYKKYGALANQYFGIYYSGSLYGAIIIGTDESLSQEDIEFVKAVSNYMAFALAINKSLDVSRNVSSTIIGEHKVQKLKLELIKEKTLLDEQQNFITTASHELRTPIAILQSSIELLKKMMDKGNISIEIIKAQINKMQSMSSRLQIVTESILSLEKFENGHFKFHPKVFDLKETLESLLVYHTNIHPSAEIVATFNNVPERYIGDKKLITLILDNIVSNAVKYSADPKVVIKGFLDTDSYKIVIKDNGIGIPKDEIENIFAKYFRATNTSGTSGSGIGLYLCKRLAELQEMKIEVHSEVGNGTQFVLILPFNATYQIGGEQIFNNINGDEGHEKSIVH